MVCDLSTLRVTLLLNLKLPQPIHFSIMLPPNRKNYRQTETIIDALVVCTLEYSLGDLPLVSIQHHSFPSFGNKHIIAENYESLGEGYPYFTHSCAVIKRYNIQRLIYLNIEHNIPISIFY